MSYTHTFKYDIGDIVYLVTDADQEAYIICSRSNSIAGDTYVVAHGRESVSVYEFEIAPEKDFSIYFNN